MAHGDKDVCRIRHNCSTGVVAVRTFGRVGRGARIQEPDSIFHVTTHGIRDHPIFVDDADRELFLRLLGKTVRRHGWYCLSYCLMTTHYHLLVETPEPTLSAGMHLLNGTYARRFNEEHEYRGHLVERRFGSELIESEYHFLEASRYVVLNPVRAGICRRVEDWPRSSYRATMGLAPRPPFLAVDRLLDHFGPRRQTARENYEAYVREGAALIEATLAA